jgi:co-chaperonin GroES (HSP10)
VADHCRRPRQAPRQRDRTALSAKVYDEVLFGRYAGSEIKGGELKVMRENDILAKIVN